ETERSSHALLVSGGIIAHLRPLPQTRKGVEGIDDSKQANGLLRKPVGQDVLAVEMPVRDICREQQHPVAAHMLERPHHHLRLARGDVARLWAHAYLLADAVGRRSIDPRRFRPYAAPGLVGSPH